MDEWQFLRSRRPIEFRPEEEVRFSMNSRLVMAVSVLGLSLASGAQSTSTPSISAVSDQSSPSSKSASAPQPESGEIVGGRLMHQEDPKYPKEAREQKLQGQVVVQITVEETGEVSRAAALSGELPLAKAAVNSVVKWRFQPFTKDGHPLRVQQNVVFNFAPGNKVAELQLPLSEPTAAKLPSVFRVGGRVSAPRPLYSPDAGYSEEARQAKYEGVCVLTLIVGPDGLPWNVRVARSLGMGLDEKAIEAVKRWRFQPAMKDGKPVAVAINVEVQFRL